MLSAPKQRQLPQVRCLREPLSIPFPLACAVRDRHLVRCKVCYDFRIAVAHNGELISPLKLIMELKHISAGTGVELKTLSGKGCCRT